MLSDQSLQLCPTLCGPVDYSLPGSSVHGLLQVRILRWVAISLFKGSAPPRNWAHIFCIAGRFFTTVPSTKLLKFTWNSDISDLVFAFCVLFWSFYFVLGYQFSSVQFNRPVVSDSATPWTAASQASLSNSNCHSLLKLMTLESVMPSNHLILCCLLLLQPSIFPSIRVFSRRVSSSHQMAKVLQFHL